jgi:hypothetical protein
MMPSSASVAWIWQLSRLKGSRSAAVISSMSRSMSSGLPALSYQASST